MEHQFIASKTFFSSVSEAVSLYKNLWKEGTTALIRAPRNTDKTAVALGIAAELAASGRPVLYVNAEENLDRLADVTAGTDNLYIFTPRYESPDDTTDYADLIFEAIEQAVATTPIRTFVIDSVSRIAALSFGRNASPAYVMKRLVALQVRCRLSLLVVADDSTKTVNNALSALAASEIPVDGEKPESKTADITTPILADPDPSTAHITTPVQRPQSATYTAPPVQLTRRQRRALQRRAAKGKLN